MSRVRSRSGRSCVTTLGKLFTPTCLDAESLRYYMESLNWVPLPLIYHISSARCSSVCRPSAIPLTHQTLTDALSFRHDMTHFRRDKTDHDGRLHSAADDVDDVYAAVVAYIYRHRDSSSGSVLTNAQTRGKRGSGKCTSGNCRSDNVWKAVAKILQTLL